MSVNVDLVFIDYTHEIIGNKGPSPPKGNCIRWIFQSSSRAASP